MNVIGQLGEEFFHGVIRVTRDRTGLRLARMTAAQIAYHEQIPDWGIRARCCAGAVLAMSTDSPTLDLRFRILSSCRNYFGIDVEIDGILSHGVRVEPHSGSYEGRLFELPGGQMREIRVYLPYTTEPCFEEISLAEGATFQPIARGSYKLLCLGDSITQGMDTKSAYSPYPNQLARLLEADLLNHGVGGHVFDAASLDTTVPFEPDLVTVAYGTNDWTRGISVEQLRVNVREFLARLRDMYPPKRTRVAVLSPIWRTCPHDRVTVLDLTAFRRTILETAGEFEGVIPIDGLSLVPPQGWYLADGTHPNDVGALHYAVGLYTQLKRAGAVWRDSRLDG